jgi:cation transport regulator ChaC
MKNDGKQKIHYYFAYGSNMLTKRLQEPGRAPKAKIEFVGRLDNYELLFNKKSTDGSGKANIVRKPGSCVYGVVFSITDEERKSLSDKEKSYSAVDISLTRTDQEMNLAEAYTYISSQTSDSLKPHASYLDYCLKGAEEHKLPEDYVQHLREIESDKDPD